VSYNYRSVTGHHLILVVEINPSLSSSYTSSSLMSNNISRSLTSVKSKTNSDDNSLFPSSFQSTKNGKSNSSEIKLANYVLSFCNCTMGTMSENIYNKPHQEQCVGRMLGGSLSKMLHCAHKGCKVKVHRFCQIDWLHRHYLEVNHDDPIFC
jgi:hypothetical protein